MEDTRIWFYAVMIFIAFVSWIRKRVKEVNEARSERGTSRQQQSEEEDRRRRESSQSSAQQSASAPKQPNSLKELFQQVAEEQARAQQEAQQKAQQQVAPPPLPEASRDKEFHQSETEFHQSETEFHQSEAEFHKAKGTFHQAEGNFHQDHQATTKHARTMGLGASLHSKETHHPANRTRTAIRTAFSDRRKIRDAFVLKEILDTPKGMQ